MKTRGIYLDTYNCPYCKNTIETIVHLFVQCPYLDKVDKSRSACRYIFNGHSKYYIIQCKI